MSKALPGFLGARIHWAFASFKPSINICSFSTVEDAQRALKEMKSEFGNKLTIRAIGVDLGYAVQDSSLTKTADYKEFPFLGPDKNFEV